MSTSASQNSREQLKAFFVILTIILATLCAFLGIILLFIGTNYTILKVLSTLLIMYLVLAYSSGNLTRTNDSSLVVRILSITALIFNVIWSIFWILLVWDVFGGMTVDFRKTLWRIVGSGVVISGFCTILAARITRLFPLATILKVYKSLPLVCAGFLGLDLLIIIWFPESGLDFTGKFIVAELILLSLQWIVTWLLISNAKRLNIDLGTESMSPKSSSASKTSNKADSIPTEGDGASTQETSSSSLSEGATQNGHPFQPQSSPKFTAQKLLCIIGIIAIVWVLLRLVIPTILLLLSIAAT